MHARFTLPFLLLAMTSPLTHGAEALALQAVQVKALGIVTQAVGSGGEARAGSLPARVLVPNEQLRIVAAPVGGMIEMLAVAPGSHVRLGQVVARLASPQALELQRDALQAGSQSALLQQSLKRDEQLFAEGLIAESRLQATRAAAAQAGAQASERRQGLALAGIAPGKLGGPLALVAPIDGVVLEQAAQLGQRVEASAPIYRIAQLSPLWLEIQAPLAVAAGLREGMAVRLAGSDLSGKLIAVGRAVDPASQTVLLRAALSKGAETLIPGQVVEVELPAVPGAAGGAQRLPTAALIRHDGQTLVFVQTASNDQGSRFEARPLRIVSQGGEMAVAEGVKPGEHIAVKGVSGLKAMLTGVGKE
ncbi:efflux RND transporter periplasmic adaptor subunit [Thauera sp. SWB20]|uniref:efflux RND transporter periplasmic adaptor subunit n=1 Tax=Thauera sp. SWB20 TaxID=1572758 RepID=UPI0005ADA649|nr:efflux RND transporter periplasmic adaptor subunit [Thauera sp. SWB20]KIN89174.1 efflux transporter, RND family, MFP subunit [Thauera sp. SWB20]TMW74196.1 efflux RND transporter periplasmic adaptor subunit [Thauera sp. UPWRP]